LPFVLYAKLQHYTKEPSPHKYKDNTKAGWYQQLGPQVPLFRFVSNLKIM